MAPFFASFYGRLEVNRFKKLSLSPAVLMATALGLSSCRPAHEPETTDPPATQTKPSTAPLSEALAFHASFDQGPNADFARGDKLIYTAPAFDKRDEAKPGIGNPNVDWAADAGRFGAALRFNKKNTHGIFFKAENHVTYTPQDWSGTASLWLNLTPGEDLEPGYCDPIQITDVRYNDAAVWVDFTKSNPRQFRLGVFGDLEVWNPNNLESDQNPEFMNRLVVVNEPPFKRGQWTHVVITYAGLGSDAGGWAKLYVNGELQGTTPSIMDPFTWDLSMAQIRVGVNYSGMFDELALFDRPLTDHEVKTLYELEGGVARLH
jgi:hypothetical protein